jgi:NDP-sugar pyrophosphorylase family protein
MLRRWRNSKIDLCFSLEKKILGTAGGIAQALRGMSHETTFVLNGDIVTDLDLKKMFALHRRARAAATLGCVPKDRAKVKSFVEFDPRGLIHSIAGIPKTDRAALHLSQGIFSGAHIVEPSLFRDYPEKHFGCVIRQIYQPALARGERFQAYRHPGEWWDLGNLSELKRVDQLLWQGKVSPGMLKLWQEAYKTSRVLCE